MSYCLARVGNEFVKFGFSDMSDWLDSIFESFPTPWTVAPLEGKHYGTIICSEGVEILSVWISAGRPSARQKEGFTDEQWAEYCCDSHWESDIALRTAELICLLRNQGDDEKCGELLRVTCMSAARWEESVWELISCGGRKKRLLNNPHDRARP